MLVPVRSLESRCLHTLNRFVEPLVRAGVGSPGLLPTGAIVLETIGRRTGRRTSVPLLATVLGDLVLVSTLRSRSQWLRDVAAHPEVRFWMLGSPRAARAVVVARGIDTAGVPASVARLASALRPWTDAIGMSFAILAPAPERGDALA